MRIKAFCKGCKLYKNSQPCKPVPLYWIVQEIPKSTIGMDIDKLYVCPLCTETEITYANYCRNCGSRLHLP